MKLFAIVVGTVIFLIVTINLFVTLVIFIAEEQHVFDHVRIYELFENKRYQKVRNQMLSNNYTLLVGDDEGGVKNFIEHQANIQTADGRAVVIKRYQSTNDNKKKLLKTLKQTRFYMQIALGLGRQERTQVFFIKHLSDLPTEEITFIKEKYPSDNIIIVSEDNIPVTIKGFKKIKFPPVKYSELGKTMHQYYQISPKEGKKIFENNGQSIEKIFNYFKKKAEREGDIPQEVVEVDDIEDLNEISQQLAERQRAKIEREMTRKEKKTSKSKKPSKQSKSSK